MATFHELSTAQLRQALQLREQIETLQKKLGSLLGGTAPVPAAKTKAAPATARRKRTMSPEARAKIAAAQQARWAKVKEKPAAKSAKPAAKPAKTTAKPAAKPAKKKGGLTPEGRAKIAAATKARWEAKRKAEAAAATTA